MGTFLYFFLKNQVQELKLKLKLLVLKELVEKNPYIEIGEKGPLTSLKDFYRLRNKSLNILVNNLVLDFTNYIKPVAKKAIFKSKTCEFFKP